MLKRAEVKQLVALGKMRNVPPKTRMILESMKEHLESAYD